MSQPASTPAPAPAAAPATPATPAAPASTPAKSEGLTEKQWADDSWDDKAPQADEEKDVEAWLSSKDDDADADDEEDWDEDEDDEPEERKPRKRQRSDEDEEPARKRKPKAPVKDSGEKPQDGKTAAPAAPSTFTVKLGRETRELDAAKMARALGTSEAELAKMPADVATRVYQKQWHAEQQQAEHTNAQRTIQNVIGNIKGRTRDVLEALGVDVREFANNVLVEEYEERTLPPEKKALRERERELAKREQAQQRQQQQQQQQTEAEHQQQAVRALHSEVELALSAAGIAVNDRNKERVFLLMQRELHERGAAGSTEPPTPAKDLIPHYDRELQEDVRSRFAGMEGPQIADYIGEDAVKKIRAHGVQKYVDQAHAQVPSREDDAPPRRRRSRPPQRERKTYADVLRSLKAGKR